MLERVISAIGPKTAKIMIVDTCPNKEDVMFGQPFKGSAGRELKRMLGEAGIDFAECFSTYVFHSWPAGNDILAYCTTAKGPRIKGFPSIKQGKYLSEECQPELDRLDAEIAEVNPNVILALGEVALAAVTGQGKLGSIRGTLVPSKTGVKTIATYSPGLVLKNWSRRVVVMADLQKVVKEQEYKELLIPARMILINPTIEEVEAFYKEHLAEAYEIALDIETKGRNVRTISFAPTPYIALVIPLMDSRNPDNNYWKTEQEELRAFLVMEKIFHKRNLKVMQNGSFDLQYIWKTLGMPIYGFGADTSLAHHALYPELEKNLGFLGSIYTTEPSWKFMRTRTEDVKKEE